MGEFGIGVPEACAVCVGASGGVAGAAGSIFGGVSEGGAIGAGEGEAEVSDIVDASGGRAFSACASSIGAAGVCATGAGVTAVSAVSGDRASGTAALDRGASGSTTTVVGMVGGCGFDACAICIDSSEARAIGVVA
nr:hypothetical protein [Burkholderia contaminans]